MTWIEALLFGIVQGITEFLPVSSSGHLTLLGRILATEEEAMLSFTTLLHVGTLISVFIVMRREIKEILKDLLGLRVRLIILATIPAVVVALLLGNLIDSLFGGSFLGYSFLITSAALAATLLRRKPADPAREIGYRDALVAGIGQAIAISPGVSRSGMTLTALLFCGIERRKAIRFSFLMSIPAILGGFLLDLVDMFRGKGAALATFGVFNILVGIAAAAVAGWLAMEFMLRHLNRRVFLICAAYVLLLAVLVLVDQHWTHILF